MGFVPYQYPKDFRDYLAATLGTRKWVVAQHLTPRLKAKGYELAVSQKKFTAIRQSYEGELKCTGQI
jgi:hypothetical protein